MIVGRALAAPSEDRILPVDQYTSQKARTLAQKYAPALRALNAGIYHCLPWLDVPKQSIGFFRPKHLAQPQDYRYLSLRIYIEQETSPQFAALGLKERASAMFSRYVGAMLRRMTERAELVTEPLLDGFSVILGWVKPTSPPGERPVHETIAVFADRPEAPGRRHHPVHEREQRAPFRPVAVEGEIDEPGLPRPHPQLLPQLST